MKPRAPSIEELCGLIADHLDLPPAAVRPGQRLGPDLQLDSLDLYAVLAGAETLFDALPPSGTLGVETTVAQLYAALLHARSEA